MAFHQTGGEHYGHNSTQKYLQYFPISSPRTHIKTEKDSIFTPILPTYKIPYSKIKHTCLESMEYDSTNPAKHMAERVVSKHVTVFSILLVAKATAVSKQRATNSLYLQ